MDDRMVSFALFLVIVVAVPVLVAVGVDIARRIAAHLKSLMDYPPSQGADTLSLKKALEDAQRKMETPHASSN